MKAPIHLIRWTALLISMVLVEWTTSAQAQVVPDATLGNGRNSAITINGNRTDITGGLQRNSALFHSFDRFSVGTNNQVYFANPAGIRNIFSRVTGGNLSNIDGVLGVTGSANLFFMNPNGIVFGPNARLDVAGSFTATTANVVEFADNQRFAATGDRAVPLVEVNLPIGLQMGTNALAMLTSRGNLAVGAGQNLSLVGGKTVNNGSLTAPGGTVQVLGNQVALQDRSRIDVSGPTGGGTVLVGGDYQGKGALVNAQTTTVASGSVINADALVNGNGGKVIVWADGDTRFNGTISAKGGVQGGNGGFVETSGKQNLGIGNAAVVNTFAPLGKAGTWLLDPASITIVANGDPRINTNTVDGANNYATPDAATATSFIAANNIFNASSPTNIELLASNFITVEALINAGTVSSGLTFTALNLNLNANVTTLGSQTYKGAVTIGTPTATLTTSNDPVTFTNTVNSAANAGNTASANNSLTIAAGTGIINFTNGVGTGTNSALGNLTTTSGEIKLNATNTNNLNVTASGEITQNGNLTVGGTTTLAAGTNNINLNGTNNLNTVQITSGGNVTLNNNNRELNLGQSNITGTLGIQTNGAITQSGNLTVGGTTTLTAGNANNINLTGANNFNTVQVTNGNDVSLNDINAINLGTSTVAGNLNVTGDSVNVPNGAKVESSGGNIRLNGATSVETAGGLKASGKTVQILGTTIRLFPDASVDVSGNIGGTVLIGGTLTGSIFKPTASSTRIPSNVIVNANSIGMGQRGGRVSIGSLNPSVIDDSRITVNGTPNTEANRGVLESPPNAVKVNSDFTDSSGASLFTNITIINGDGQNLITNPSVTTDPILSQLFFSNDPFQNFQIPQTILARTTPTLYRSFFTGQNIVLKASNNITVEDLANNQLTLATAPSPGGKIQFNAGNIFTMNQGDLIQTNGRSIQISADANNLLPPGNSLTIGSINASSTTRVGGNIELNARNGNIAIGNGINPATIASNSANDLTVAAGIKVLAPNGNINVTDTAITANSANLTNGLAGQISFNAGNSIALNPKTSITANGQRGLVTLDANNTVRLSDTDISADGQFGRILIGQSGPPDTIQIQNSSNLSAQNSGILDQPDPVSGLIGLRAKTSVQVDSSGLSTSAPAGAIGGSISIRTTDDFTGEIALTNSTLRASGIGSGRAGAVNLRDARRISLRNTRIFTTVIDGDGGGTTINGGTINITDKTALVANTAGTGKAGNIEITATGTASNSTTPTLLIEENSNIQAQTSKAGPAGTTTLKADNGNIAIKSNSTVSSQATASASNNSGTVTVSSNNLSITDGSFIEAKSLGTGAPGSINVNVDDKILISGTNSTGRVSEISVVSGPNANLSKNPINGENLGKVTITANNLEISNRGRINARTDSTNPAYTGGSINIMTNQLTLATGGQILASSTKNAAAEAGAVTINANAINISGSALSFKDDPAFGATVDFKSVGQAYFDNSTNSGFLLADSFSTPIGDLQSKLGLSSTGVPSGATSGSAIQFSVVGNPNTLQFGYNFSEFNFFGFPSGDQSFLTINGQNAQVLNPPVTSNNTTSLPSGGNLTITLGLVKKGTSFFDFFPSSLALNNIRLDGQPIKVLNNAEQNIDPSKSFISGIYAQADGVGNAGNVTITGTGLTPNLTLNQAGKISTATDSGGSVGARSNITIKDFNTINVGGSDSKISASTNTGVAGNVAITMDQGNNSIVNVSNNGRIEAKAGDAASSLAGKDAGRVTITTPNLNVNSGGAISVSNEFGTGTAGDITVQAANVTLNQGKIEARTDAGGSISLANINLNTQNLTVNSDSQIVASTKSGVGGNVNLRGLNTLQMNDGKLIASADGKNGEAGNVTVTSADISLTGNKARSEIRTSAKGEGAKAGNITLNTAGGNITLQKSDVIASSENGPSGVINITARRTNLNNGTIRAETGKTISGVTTGGIELNVSFRMTLENEGEISTLGKNGADGGNISIMGVRYLLGERPTGPNGSDIIGRAEPASDKRVGKGGTVEIDRITLVSGFRFRKAEDGNGTNDIDTNGQLNNFSTDADIVGRGLSTPLIVFNDVSQIVRSACEAVGAKTATTSELKIASQGGVPLSPTTALPAQNPSSDWVTLEFSPQVPIGLKTADGTTITLEPGKHYQLPATCVKSWQQQQQSQLPIPPNSKKIPLPNPNLNR